jgi:hypothetical protein
VSSCCGSPSADGGSAVGDGRVRFCRRRMATIPQMTSAATAAPMSPHPQPGRPPAPEELGVVELSDAELDSKESFFFAALAAAAAAAAPAAAA